MLPSVDECNGACRLDQLPAGTTARLLGFSGLADRSRGRLTAHGLFPGVDVEVVQRLPALILEIYETELAVDTELAAGIWVVPISPSARP